MDSFKFDDYFPLHYCTNLSAGSFDEILDAEPDAVVYVPIKFQGRRKKLLAFQVNGTSMNNVIEDGSIVVVENTSNDGVNYKDGTIIVAYCDGMVTVKRLYRQPDGNVMLAPDSSDKTHLHIMINTTEQQLVIIGKVLWHMNPDDIAEKKY
jgi:repressor LexA